MNHTNPSIRAAALAGGALLLALLVPAGARAAAAKGEFGIKGIGATSCDVVVREYKAGTPNAMMYGGWLYGYLTAMNQLTPDTFDLAPWQDLNTLTNFVVEYCKKNPRTSFAQATFNMVNALKPARMKTVSMPVRIGYKERSLVVYGDTLERAAQALKAKGYYKGSDPGSNRGNDKGSGVMNDELARAFTAFQAKNKLEQTGGPDQATLFYLFATPARAGSR